ncbi:hypothetical protein F7725_010582, partial [Dissostichus mawsoni]
MSAQEAKAPTTSRGLSSGSMQPSVSVTPAGSRFIPRPNTPTPTGRPTGALCDARLSSSESLHDEELTLSAAQPQEEPGRCTPPSRRMAVLGNPDMLTRKIKLCHINAHITCRLCDGYLIDATTVTESCLVKYLEENNTCPTSEIKKQRDFYQKLGMEVPGDIKGDHCHMKTHLDQRNGDTKTEDAVHKEPGEEKPEEENDYHRSDEQVSICLECNSSKLRGLKRKWIRCSAQATVLHLKKFIAKKLNLTSFNELDILCNEEILGKDHTLKFVVVTRWRF